MISCQEFKFGSAIMVKNNRDNFVWRLIVIYGPAYNDMKMEFLEELHNIMGNWDGPTILRGGGVILI
jgi:hypothetical protein